MNSLTIIIVLGILAGNADARLRSNTTNATVNIHQAMTFTSYYNAVTAGRGVWKWQNAVAAYDKHLLRFQGFPTIGSEVGLQSGGSILMWNAVIGAKMAMNGLDINPDTVKFVDASTSITIGDQENPKMWEEFFGQTGQTLDFLVDDGGHTAPQMIQTTYSVWPKLKPGGVLAIEDILGNQYLTPFFEPLAQFLGGQTDVDSVHLYPYLMVAQKVGSTIPPYDPSLVAGAVIPPTGRIADLAAFDAALAAAPPGSLIVLENAGWGRFINPNGLASFFRRFIDLYQPQSMYDEPAGCASTSAPVCSSITPNSALQAKVLGVHILANKLVVEVPATVPDIRAVRHGTDWMPPLKQPMERLAAHLGPGRNAAYNPATR